MYMRFVIHKNDEDSGRRVGLFQVSRDLRDAKLVNVFEEAQLLAIKDWFNENLERPASFSRSKKPNAKKVALSWFKDSATAHISKMYELKSILEVHGIYVEVIRTNRPGYIVYEDEYQVVAEPYSETQT